MEKVNLEPLKPRQVLPESKELQMKNILDWLNKYGKRVYDAKEGVCYPTDQIYKAIKACL